MKQRPRIYYSESQKALMWERWHLGAFVELKSASSRRLFHQATPNSPRYAGLTPTGNIRALRKTAVGGVKILM